MSTEERKVPELRFKGFSDDWEQRKLGEIGYTFTGLQGKTKADFGLGSANYVPYTNIFNNIFVDTNQLEKIEIDNKQNQLKYGDILFTTSSETPLEVGMSSIWLGQMSNVYLNSFCFGYRLKTSIDLFFLAFLLRSPYFRKKMSILAQGISRYNISKAKVMEIIISLPETSEQNYIGEILKKVDILINLHQRKINILNKIKKSYLKKMFADPVNKVPYLRFKGFKKEWEQRNFFKNISSIIDFRGRTPKKLGMDWSDSGYLALSALNVKNGYIDRTKEAKYGSEELYEKWMGNTPLRKGFVLFTTEAPMGNVALVPDNEGYILSQRTISLDTHKHLMSNLFLATLLRTPTVINRLTSLSSGATAKGVSQKSLSSLKVTVPNTLNEQNSIALLIDLLEKRIILHQNKLTKLNDLKKEYLNKMFI